MTPRPAKTSKTPSKRPRTNTKRTPAAVNPKKQRPESPGKPPASLTADQRKMLRGLGHVLRPVVLVGKEGITDGVISSIKEALIDHELVKTRLLQSCDIDKDEAAQELSERAGAVLVQRIGKTILLYAPHPTDPVISLGS
ncbi:MAG: ribosome assembly RNA-binding protein YhbY [Myxococcales bacterium]|nr:ribosome assembly RNA-binding protein YhbY [Myxococcales bacterium]